MSQLSDTKCVVLQTANGFTRILRRCFCVFAFTMPGRLFLVSALLSCCAGEVSMKMPVFAGQTVILPCHINVGNLDFPTVEWLFKGPDQKIALLYRQGCETFAEKDPAFHFRTNLFMNELKNGNISLRLSNVQLSDTGTFICKTIRSKPQEIARIELVVAAVSEPKLLMVSAVDGEVTLQCEASCWSPQPEITFVDTQGNNISAENPKPDEDPSARCFTATSRATVRTANRVTCRVHLPGMNETRLKDIYVPDDCLKRKERESNSCNAFTVTAVLITAFVTAIISCALTSLLWKTCCNSVGKSKTSSTCSNADGHNLRNPADPTGNAATEHLRRIGDLESSLREKDEIIHRLTEELKDLRSKQGPPTNLLPEQSPHNNTPKPAASVYRKHAISVTLPLSKDSKPGVAMRNPAPDRQIKSGSHRQSCPALLTHVSTTLPSESSALPSEERHVVRSMSMSASRPRQNNSKPKRRNTTSPMSYNHYKKLPGLAEDDSELLLNNEKP